MARVLPLLFVVLVLLTQESAWAREWTDRTGKFSVEAELLEVSAERVVLKKADGRTVSVPIERLSEADRRYLASQGMKATGFDSVAEPVENGIGDAAEVPSRVATQAVLGKPTSFHFTNVSLVEALDEIASQHRIAMHLERGALETAGLTDTASVSGEANQEPLDKSLEKLLGKLNLIAMVADDVLLVTTPDKGASRLEALETMVYRFPGNVLESEDFKKPLMGDIARASWGIYNKGGKGQIFSWHPEALTARPSALIIDQTPSVHREIQRKYGGQLSLVPTAQWKDSPLQKVVHQETAERLRRLAVCEFSNTPVSEVARTLSERYGIPVSIDLDNAGKIGASADRRITIRLTGIPLESILTLMLRDLGLDWSLNQDGVRITTREREEQAAEKLTLVYEFRDYGYDIRSRGYIAGVICGLENLPYSKIGGDDTDYYALAGETKNSTRIRIRATYQVHRRIERLLGTLNSLL